jgi:hypothetical protein
MMIVVPYYFTANWIGLTRRRSFDCSIVGNIGNVSWCSTTNGFTLSSTPEALCVACRRERLVGRLARLNDLCEEVAVVLT